MANDYRRSPRKIAHGVWLVGAMMLSVAAVEFFWRGSVLPRSLGGGYWFWDRCDAGNQTWLQQAVLCWDEGVLIISLAAVGCILVFAGLVLLRRKIRAGPRGHGA